jgi:hypothetical protein
MHVTCKYVGCGISDFADGHQGEQGAEGAGRGRQTGGEVDLVESGRHRKYVRKTGQLANWALGDACYLQVRGVRDQRLCGRASREWHPHIFTVASAFHKIYFSPCLAASARSDPAPHVLAGNMHLPVPNLPAVRSSRSRFVVDFASCRGRRRGQTWTGAPLCRVIVEEDLYHIDSRKCNMLSEMDVFIASTTIAGSPSFESTSPTETPIARTVA